MVKVPETSLQALFEDGRLYSMQEYIDKYPEAWTPELQKFIEDFNAKKTAEESPEPIKYHDWEKEDFIVKTKELLEKLTYLHGFYEGLYNDKAETVEQIIVKGNNALSRAYCAFDKNETRKRFIEFLELAESQF